ncbi:MAG: AsnC family transcriptional regulator [Thermofilum sp. ex4484_15]|nr:MAG: AsnC family transcriptional regulator [Thermofilum sp. ex4484_15]
MNNVNLDEIDRRILRVLQEDAKTPYSKISEELGISEATVHLRIKRLMKMGVIRGFQAIIDPAKVGKSITAIIAINSEPKMYERVLETLKKFEDIYEIYDVTGDYYAILKVRVNSRDELARILDKIGEIDGVKSTKTMYVLRTIKEESKIHL